MTLGKGARSSATMPSGNSSAAERVALSKSTMPISESGPHNGRQGRGCELLPDFIRRPDYGGNELRGPTVLRQPLSRRHLCEPVEPGAFCLDMAHVTNEVRRHGFKDRSISVTDTLVKRLRLFLLDWELPVTATRSTAAPASPAQPPRHQGRACLQILRGENARAIGPQRRNRETDGPMSTQCPHLSRAP